MKLGEEYVWAMPHRLPIKGKVVKVSKANKWVEFDWESPGAPKRHALPLDEFFFKVEQ